jgi:GMP synthase (glutamine-hydrolysing)
MQTDACVLVVSHHANVGLALFEPVIRRSGLAVETASYADASPPGRPLADYAATIVLGGSPQVDQEQRYPWLIDEKRAIAAMLDGQLPVLGICLGAQLMAEAAGARVGPTQPPRVGWGHVELHAAASADVLFGELQSPLETVVWHTYGFDLPPHAAALASTATALQAFKLTDVPAWGIQFHPEVSPGDVEAWLDAAVERDELTEQGCERERENGVRLRAQQERLAAHICGQFVDVALGRARQLKPAPAC